MPHDPLGEKMAQAIRNFTLDEPIAAPLAAEVIATLSRYMAELEELNKRTGPANSITATIHTQYVVRLLSDLTACVEAIYNATFMGAMERMTANELAGQIVVPPQLRTVGKAE